MITLVEKDQWVTIPKGYLTIKYEASMSSLTGVAIYGFYWKVWLESSISFYNDEISLSFSIKNEDYKTETVHYGTDKGWSVSGYTQLYASKESRKCSVEIVMRNVSASKILFYNNFSIEVPPMKSEIASTDDFDIDGNIDLDIRKDQADTDDTLYIKLNDTVVKTIPDVSSGHFTFTEAEREVIYNMMSDENMASFEFTVTSTLGTHTVRRNGRITNAEPELDASLIDYFDGSFIQDAINDASIIVQGLSYVFVYIPLATARKGASIVRYQVTIGERFYDDVPSFWFEFGEISSKGDQYITITATDSRGNTCEAKKAIYVYEYFKPMFTATAKRKNNYEAETTFKVDAQITSVNGANDVESISYTVAKVGEAHGNSILIQNGETHFLTCDQRYAYEFIVTVTDKFRQSNTHIVKLAKGKVPLFVDTEKNAVGINAFPMADEALRVGDGVAVFEDGIVIKSSTQGSAKLFKLIVDDNGNINAIEYE